MTPIALDLDIGNTIKVIDDILAARGDRQKTVWEYLSDRLQAVSVAVGDLDRWYLALLADLEEVFAEPEPSFERIEAAIRRGDAYCSDGRLALALSEWCGAIEAAAFSDVLQQRKYRTLTSVLRSINDPLNRYVLRLEYLQGGGRYNVPESAPGDRKWDLRTALDLVKSMAFPFQADTVVKGAADVRHACEQAIRNYDRALSLSLAHLVGMARQDLAMETF